MEMPNTEITGMVDWIAAEIRRERREERPYRLFYSWVIGTNKDPLEVSYNLVSDDPALD
jgi:hypothetical protein